MYVVTGATGHTGSAVARTLLDRGEKVRVVMREAGKDATFRKRGAELTVARLEDAGAVAEALRGADGAYLMVPPNFTSNQVVADSKRIVDALAHAVEAARPKHVVLLSSVGAELPSGNGPIQVLHYAEERFGKLPVAVTILRPTYFMENWASALGAVQGQSILPSTLTRDRAFPMVATADIGRVAADALLRGASAPRPVELAGPQDYTPVQVAEAFSRILGREIRLIDVPEAGIVPAIRRAGLTEDLANLYREMIAAINAGRVAFHGQPARGLVSLETVLRGLLGK